MVLRPNGLLLYLPNDILVTLEVHLIHTPPKESHQFNSDGRCSS